MGWWAPNASSASASASSSPAWWWPFQTEQQRRHAQFCTTAFPGMWDAWVTSFTDFGFAGFATAPPPAPEEQQQPPPSVLPAAPRLVAIGDLHGDLRKAWRAFRLAGLVDDKGRWSGGSTVCVQVGDILDRGDQEIQIFYFLERLQREAAAAGGALWVLNGNHETMNVAANHRYATPGSGLELMRWKAWQALAERLRRQCNCSGRQVTPSSSGKGPQGLPPTPPSSSSFWPSLRFSSSTSATPPPPPPPPPPLPRPPTSLLSGGSSIVSALHFERTAAMQPGAELTKRFMSSHPISLQVGSSLFVHGGVLPEHVEYGLDRINRETQSWLVEGAAAKPPNFLRGSSAIVWARHYSAEDEGRCDCDKLRHVLQSIPGAQRMVVGHTIQSQGVNAACDGRVVRVDVGLSRGCGDGQPQVLEILDDSRIRRLREAGPPEELGTKGRDQHGVLGGQASGPSSGEQPTSGWEGMRQQLRELFAGGPDASPA